MYKYDIEVGDPVKYTRDARVGVVKSISLGIQWAAVIKFNDGGGLEKVLIDDLILVKKRGAREESPAHQEETAEKKGIVVSEKDITRAFAKVTTEIVNDIGHDPVLIILIGGVFATKLCKTLFSENEEK